MRQSLGSRVCNVRTERGYSRQQLADLANLNVTTVTRLENNDIGSRSKVLTAIALVLGVEEEWLKTGRAPKYLKNDLKTLAHRPHIEPLLKLLQQLREEQVELLLKLAEAMLAQITRKKRR